MLDGDRWVFIDWDGAGPGSRLWDLAYAAHGFVPLAAGGDPAADGPRLRALADGYGAGRRPAAGAARADRRAHPRHVRPADARRPGPGAQPWARLHAEGHAGHWGPAADYIDRHRQAWTRALLD